MNTMNGSEELKLASSNLSRGMKQTLRRLRKKLGPAFVLLLRDIEADLPSYQVAQRWQLRPYQVVLWRKVLTFPSRKLIPDLAIFTGESLHYIQGEKHDCFEDDTGGDGSADLHGTRLTKNKRA